MLRAEPDVRDFYPERVGYWGVGYTSPTYHYYLENFLSLIDGERVINCSGGGFLYGNSVACMELEEWISNVSSHAIGSGS